MRIVEGRRRDNQFTKRWKALIEETKSFWLRRKRYRYVLYAYWTGWYPEYKSRLYKSREKCVNAANRELDQIENWLRGEWL